MNAIEPAATQSGSMEAQTGAAASKRVCLLVLGMHRSGTSALARVLSLAGAALPKRLMGPGPGNESGHWEPIELVGFHEDLLHELGSAWYDWREIDIGKLSPERRDTLKARLRRLLDIDYGDNDPIVVKDPRVCRFVPLFCEVAEEAGYDVKAIHALRHPREVVKSLQSRKEAWPAGYTATEAELLWLRHVVDVEDACNGRSRAVVSYDRLMADPAQVLSALQQQLGLVLPRSWADIAGEVAAFISPTQRHQRVAASEVASGAGLEPWSIGLFDALAALERDPGDAQAQVAVGDISAHFAKTAGVIARVMSAMPDSFGMKQDLTAAQSNLAHMRRALAVTKNELVVTQNKANHHAQVSDAKLSVLSSQLTVAQNQLAGTRGEYEARIAALQDELERVRTHASALATQIEAASTNSAGDDEPVVDEYSDKARADIEKLTDELAAAKAAWDTLNTELAAVKGTSQALSRELATAKDVSQELTQELASSKGASEALRDELAASRDRIASLASDLAVAQSKSQALEIERLDFMRTIRRIEVDRDLRAEECQLLRKEIDTTHHHYLNSKSWRYTEPLRWAYRVPGALKRATKHMPVALRVGGGVGNTVLRSISVLRSEGPSGIAARLQRFEPPVQTVSVAQDALFAPLVSIIVPNYNHAPYLEQRLDSIYAQDYKNVEVILLDDKSSDGSVKILRNYRDRYPGMTILIENSENSGSGYKQWEKGLSLANGELIWIAESDDWSEPNFLSTLVPSFRDDSILLSYCNSQFMDEKGKEVVWSTGEYLKDIDPYLWAGEFTMTAHALVQKAWAQKNIVVNVSSAVFRRPPRAYESAWRDMKICGDWLLYLNIIKGGRVHYTAHVNNYYRMHTSNTSKAMFLRDVYYKEHEAVADFAIDGFNVEPAFLDRQYAHMRDQWARYRPNDDIAELEKHYSPERIRARIAKRPPCILMVGFAFAAGGGETFPIFIANMLRARGFPVTFLNCDQAEREKDVRLLLRKDIAVVHGIGQLRDVVADYGIDVIHSHHAWVDQSILDILLPGTLCKTVVTTHGMYEAMVEPQRSTLVHRLIERAGAIVYTAMKNLAPFQENGVADHPKITRIDNALEEVAYQAVPRSELYLAEDAFVLCLVSRAIPEKGWAEAIEAVSLARARSGRDIQLLLVGNGDEDDRLRHLHATSEFVKFLGFRRNLRDFYATADMGFLPSRFPGESYPLTVIDCLATGTPVLASAIGEIPAMVTADGEVAGCLFDLEDWQIPVGKLADIIVACASDEKNFARMKAATAKAYAQFDPNVMMSKYITVYQKLIHPE